MPRVKRGKSHVKHRKNILKRTKGYKWGRKSKIKIAQTAWRKAGVESYRGRKLKKRDMRALWNIKISAALKSKGMSYAATMGKLKKAHIDIDRKILAELAEHHPNVFEAILKEV